MQYAQFWSLMFRSSHFSFFVLVTFGDKVMKILHNLCLHFAKQTRKENLKWPKYQKPKDENMGWTKHYFHKVSFSRDVFVDFVYNSTLQCLALQLTFIHILWKYIGSWKCDFRRDVNPLCNLPWHFFCYVFKFSLFYILSY